MSTDYQAEKEAFLSLAKLLNQIEETKHLFERAGVPLPDPLKRVLGGANGIAKPIPRAHITPIERASRPSISDESWLSIEVGEATATSLVLAMLRIENHPIKVSELVRMIAQVNPKIPRGSIHNIGTRLDGKLIKRTEEGWSLIHPEKAPMIHEGFLWGPQTVFDKQDLAAHRREAILHILRCFPSGLQIVQMVEQLKANTWMHAPASKDLVKADMELLEAHGKIRRIGNSRKWEVIE
jgi:hypothetical protein